MDSHKHPLTEGEVRLEEVFHAEYLSEGCEEHYKERAVKSDDAYGMGSSVGGVNPYLRAIVIGEALATPRCKVPYRKHKS